MVLSAHSFIKVSGCTMISCLSCPPKVVQFLKLSYRNLVFGCGLERVVVGPSGCFAANLSDRGWSVEFNFPDIGEFAAFCFNYLVFLAGFVAIHDKIIM